VQGLSVSPSGQVAVAMTNSSSLAVFDPASSAFTRILMPAKAEEPLAVAYASDGSLGVALANFATHQNHQAIIVTTSGRIAMATVPDSTQIIADRPGGFIVGSWRPTVLTANGLYRVGSCSDLDTAARPCLPLPPPPIQIPSTSGSAPPCRRPTIQVMATDGRGNVWVVAPDRPDTVERVTW
jgi:hypothetical protein